MTEINAKARAETANPVTDESAKITTVEALRKAFPALTAQIREEGVQAERERIKALDAYADLAPAAVLEDAKYGSALNAEQCAVKILMAQREGMKTKAAQLAADGATAAAELGTVMAGAPALTSVSAENAAADLIINALKED